MYNHCNSKVTIQRMRRSICAPWIVLLLLLALPAAVQAQFTYTTNNGTITITGYYGSGGDLTIPDTINGLPVTDIGKYALGGCDNRGASSVWPQSVWTGGPWFGGPKPSTLRDR